VTARGRGSTRAGRGALQPLGSYDATGAQAGGWGEQAGLVVHFHGEDGRDKLLEVHRLPLPGWHEGVAAALAARVGPTGRRRTRASVASVWGTWARLMRFLAALPNSPLAPGELRAAHLEEFRRRRAASSSDGSAWKELREVFALLRTAPLRRLLPPEVVEYAGQRIRDDVLEPRPGYSDREFRSLLQAARSDAAAIRDRIRAGERRLAEHLQDPLSRPEREHGQLLAAMAGTGEVPTPPGAGGMTSAVRRDLAGELFLTILDLVPLLVLLAAASGRNIETIKELPIEHRLIEDRVVELRVVKRRRGPQHWWETVTWEIGPPERQLHTPGGLYLLAHRLTERSRGFTGCAAIPRLPSGPRRWSAKRWSTRNGPR